MHGQTLAYVLALLLHAVGSMSQLPDDVHVASAKTDRDVKGL